jgi:hypothetical protein
MRHRRYRAELGLAVTAIASCLLLAAAAAAGLPPRTFYRESPDTCAVCRATCLKPWSIPDRWNDTGAPGFPEWAGNGRWDSEPYGDSNRNGYWDPGEPFTDRNGDGQFTSEFYHPLITGYLASSDLGSEIVLKPGSEHGPAPGCFFVVDFGSPAHQSESGDRYADEISNCSSQQAGAGDAIYVRSGNLVGPTTRGVETLVARDPLARWDPFTQSVQGSAYATSPRVALIAVHDPRPDLPPNQGDVRVVKIIALFIEGIQGNGDLTGRFVRLPLPGAPPCSTGLTAKQAFVVTSCP